MMIKLILMIFIIYIYLDSTNKKTHNTFPKLVSKPLIAIAYFNENNIKGTVEFFESTNSNRLKIILDLKGLKPNFKHGFHVHEAGDLTDHCTSMCAHFNPFNKNHGGPSAKINRHVGDLGNIQTDSNGNAKYVFYDNMISLRGKTNIIGRGLIIHANTDDCGKGSNLESLKTGNAGKRIACSIIGYSKKNFI
jgi:Cu-Zn family superoxide dismutase